MKNTHLEHPEDTILTGDLSVLDALEQEQEISVKYDGAPATYGERTQPQAVSS